MNESSTNYPIYVDSRMNGFDRSLIGLWAFWQYDDRMTAIYTPRPTIVPKSPQAGCSFLLRIILFPTFPLPVALMRRQYKEYSRPWDPAPWLSPPFFSGQSCTRKLRWVDDYPSQFCILQNENLFPRSKWAMFRVRNTPAATRGFEKIEPALLLASRMILHTPRAYAIFIRRWIVGSEDEWLDPETELKLPDDEVIFSDSS